MQYYRCKCGKAEAHTSMGVYPCDRCAECGSDLSQNPNNHQEPKDHDLVVTKVQTDEGEKTLSRCRWCLRTKAQIEKVEHRHQAVQF